MEAVGARAGTTQVRASYTGFQIEPISLSVFAGAPLALELQPEAPNFQVGDSFPMRASGRYANLGLHDLTRACVWSSSMPLAASISNAPQTAGIMTMHRAGSGVISARLGALSATTI
jgi:hypothetical protein